MALPSSKKQVLAPRRWRVWTIVAAVLSLLILAPVPWAWVIIWGIAIPVVWVRTGRTVAEWKRNVGASSKAEWAAFVASFDGPRAPKDQWVPHSALASVQNAERATNRPAPSGAVSRKISAVQVVFREVQRIDTSRLDAAQAYSYSWGFQHAPRVGDWVIVGDDDSTAVVVALGRGEGARGMTLSPVVRTLPDHEVDATIAASDMAEATWLDMARAKAGLPVVSQLPSNPPADFPAIPPVRGRVIGEQAKERGRTWWWIYKAAERNRRPDDEVAAFKAIGEMWFERSRMKPQ